MTITAIRGFKDILPKDTYLWQKIEGEAKALFESYGFSEIRIPIVERTELFKRGIGEVTDIVEKEMYTFSDRHGDSITLRPEGTASVVRAYIEHKLFNLPISKLYYMGPMFRYERPQKGRYRQFYQIGAEVLAEKNPMLDAEVLEMLMCLFKRLKLVNITLHINSLGCRSCRPQYKEVLKAFLEDKKKLLCENCLRRVEINPFRVIDCKGKGCREATADIPSISEHLCTECSDHFEAVKRNLELYGIQAVINNRMVRGLDYYTKTTFEITAEGLGAQNTVAAGGRYDMLVKDLGGPDTPCFGFAIGIERVVLILKDQIQLKRPLVFFVMFGDEKVEEMGIQIIRQLRKSGVTVERDYGNRSIKAQFKRADKMGARHVLILGTDEIAAGTIALKDMLTGEQENIPLQKCKEIVIEKTLHIKQP